MPDPEKATFHSPSAISGTEQRILATIPRSFITAQIAQNEVVYSVVLTKAGNPLSREDVESHFEGELSKK
jgi:hypothetical protein